MCADVLEVRSSGTSRSCCLIFFVGGYVVTRTDGAASLETRDEREQATDDRPT
ncbi:hypothetical protein [Natronoglomus mannanivorans]|uniref:hypothetical protein n=1 Tax=Natronoglomus mannanivorans TaxID=2979990 RepID=UPI0030836F82